MYRAFVHVAQLDLATGADPAAVGAAVTVALCGHWEHDGPCRWPHHTAVDRQAGPSITTRTVFASPEPDEPAVRELIAMALRTGPLAGADGISRWTRTADGPDYLRPDEEQLGRRLGGRGGETGAAPTPAP